MPKYTPPPAWTIRGPLQSSPGNPYPWQYALYLPNGTWAYAFGKTPAEAKKGIEEQQDSLMARDWT